MPTTDFRPAREAIDLADRAVFSALHTVSPSSKAREAARDARVHAGNANRVALSNPEGPPVVLECLGLAQDAIVLALSHTSGINATLALEAEQEMWDMINRANPGSAVNEGLVARTVRTRRGDRAVILTDQMVERTSDSGLIDTSDGDLVIWYRLGKPFLQDGGRVRYGYLRFDAAVASERDRRRARRDCDEAHPPRHG